MKHLLLQVWKQFPDDFRGRVGGKVKCFLYNFRYAKDVEKCIENYNLDTPELFTAIEIETVNRCNGKCTFCPVNVNEKQRKYAKMEEGLFKKIISELKDINYEGELALFSNNEPFLDERIIEWNKYARKELPGAYIYLFTNGSLLDIQKVQEIIKYIDKLVIDNYDENELNCKLKEIDVWRKNTQNEKKVVIVPRKRNEILTSRGGQAPNKRMIRGIRAKCFYPYKQLVVRPDGKISLCCNDALGIYTMGDLNKKSILQIWNSKEYKRLRLEMKKHGRRRLKLCKNCDTRNYPGKEKSS